MKTTLILIMFLAGMGLQQTELSRVRALYAAAADKREAAEAMLDLTDAYDSSAPVLLGYKGAAHMMMAKHVGNPFKKLKHFNRGKEIFDLAIATDPESVELRFLRFSVQAEAPGFLGYRENLEEDKHMLLEGISRIQDEQVRKMILNYLEGSEELSGPEKRSIK